MPDRSPFLNDDLSPFSNNYKFSRTEERSLGHKYYLLNLSEAGKFEHLDSVISLIDLN